MPVAVADLLGRRAADAEDVGERDLQPLLAGDVDAGDACHVVSALPLLVPGVLQMTCTRPWRRITLHFSQIVLTLGRTFMGLA